MNAIYVWGLSRVLGAEVIVRIEDHDRTRCRPWFEAALLEDLEWLGFLGADAAIVRQSDRVHVYEEALQRLQRTHHVYACECSRTDIGGERYAGRCRDKGLADEPGRGLRVAIGPGTERFDDLLAGTLEQDPADQCGDLLLRDRHGHWTYQFAVTVDDVSQGVTLIIRGADLIGSTGRQIRLARLLIGGPPDPPLYLHHTLVPGPDGVKLSKSTGATGVRALRERGLSASDVIGRAAHAAGRLDEIRPVDAARTADLFEEQGTVRGRRR